MCGNLTKHHLGLEIELDLSNLSLQQTCNVEKYIQYINDPRRLASSYSYFERGILLNHTHPKSSSALPGYLVQRHSTCILL